MKKKRGNGEAKRKKMRKQKEKPRTMKREQRTQNEPDKREAKRKNEKTVNRFPAIDMTEKSVGVRNKNSTPCVHMR